MLLLLLFYGCICNPIKSFPFFLAPENSVYKEPNSGLVKALFFWFGPIDHIHAPEALLDRIIIFIHPVKFRASSIDHDPSFTTIWIDYEGDISILYAVLQFLLFFI